MTSFDVLSASTFDREIYFNFEDEFSKIPNTLAGVLREVTFLVHKCTVEVARKIIDFVKIGARAVLRPETDEIEKELYEIVQKGQYEGQVNLENILNI
jgi:hypothetical protein